MPLSPAAARRGVDVSLALDVLRGLAAISMVVNHVAVQLLARADFHGAAALATFASVHRFAFESQALVTLGQLALGAWLLRAPRRRPAVAVA